MSELTLKAIEQLLDTKLGGTEQRIIKRIGESQEELARIIASTIATPFTQRFDRLEELLEVKQEVQILKRQMAEIRSALHLSV